MLIKLSVIVVLGLPALAVLGFEVLLNATAVYNHANVAIPVEIDHWLRWLIVTPDMHRVHHSVVPNEANSNFGFNLSWWDRLLGTYRSQPGVPHNDMTIGISGYRNPAQVNRIIGMLLLPFIGRETANGINNRDEQSVVKKSI